MHARRRVTGRVTRAMAPAMVVLPLLFGGSGCAYVSADVPEVTKTLAGSPSLEFAGMGALAGTRVEATSQLDASLGKTDLFEYVTRGEVRQVRFAPRTGVSRLDFVYAIKLRFSGGADLPAQTLGTFSKGTKPLEPDGSILLDIDGTFEHTEYLESDPLLLELSVDAAAPAQDWSARIDLQMALESSRQVSL